MFSKTIFKVAFLFVLLISFSGFAQVITSKKEAIKKGVYQKPTANVNTDKVIAKIEKSQKNTSKVPKSAKIVKTKKVVLNESEDKDLLPQPKDNYLALQMINNAMQFIGVQYSGGGTTKAGMDCSGMVTAVFDIFDMKIPRSSNEMSRVGKKLDQKEIQKGDLIFFKTNGRNIINHVGMVVDVIGDEIKFVHSSTSKGVIVSSTKESYYSRAFAQANRILQQ